MARLMILPLMWAFLLCSCGIRSNKNEVTTVRVTDSLLSVRQIADSMLVEKRIINDTLVFIRKVNQRIYDKKYVLRNGDVKTEHYDGKERAGATFVIDSLGQYKTYEYIKDGSAVFSAKYDVNQVLSQVEGSVFLHSLNNVDGLLLGDTLWVNITVIPVPYSEYELCVKATDQPWKCKSVVRTNGVKPIVDYQIIEKDSMKWEYRVHLKSIVGDSIYAPFKFVVNYPVENR